jgi:hypothetical protein
MVVGNGTSSVAERLARTTLESYRLFVAGLVTVQEHNMKLARYSTGVLVGQAEKQREAWQAMVEESFKVYTGLYAPVSSPRNGLRGGDGGSKNLPIEDYDQLSVKEVIGRLDGLSAGQVEELKAYEKKNKNRPTLIEWFDRRLV